MASKNVRGYSRLIIFLVISSVLLIGGVIADVILSQEARTVPPSLLEADIDTLLDGLERGTFTSAYIGRINEVNNALNVVNEINPDAISIASQLDAERSKGLVRGPLHGIPILIKDTIATNDRMNTTAGSYALLGAKVPADATVVQNLRKAGAIILGKTNLSQWGSIRSLNSTNGWSAVGGQTHGVFYPNQDPSGSSSGSGVAATLGLATGCLGGETDGSITDPASYNNIVGIKPTVGLVSRHLVVPISQRMDTVGPMTRTVKDGAYILQGIAGVDPLDNYTSVIPNQTVPDFVSACNLSALNGARLGVPRNVISLMANSTTESVVEAFEESLGVLRSAGAIIIENTNFPAAEDFLGNYSLNLEIMGADFVVNLKQYLDLLDYNPANITSLADLRSFTQSSPLEEYKIRDTGIWDAALQNWNNTEPGFWTAYQQALYYCNEGGLLGAIKQHNLDAVILPSHFSWDWAAAVGAPIVSIPMGAYPSDQPVEMDTWGLVETGPNIPFGLGFLGARFTDAKLIGLAYAYEQRTMVQKSVQPYIVPRIELQDVLGQG
ncbi:glutamyl-tRNA amidotransferase subunit A [Xylaria digitata]|nr:glutamyl-tRNA amidotransferase subunit A [Xylaria digitata]